MQIKIADLCIDTDARTIKRGAEWISLTKKEYEVLEYLAQHKGKVVSRRELMECVWGCDYDCMSNVVDVYIRFLRAKIDDGRDHKLIRTYRKKGYGLSEQGGK